MKVFLIKILEFDITGIDEDSLTCGIDTGNVHKCLWGEDIFNITIGE